MSGIALHCLDQIGDQVLTLLQLHVDVGERLIGRLIQRHQLVVGPDDDEQQNDDDDADDPPRTYDNDPDNTPPVIRNLAATGNGNRVTITFNATDASTILTKAEYSINATEWIYLEPTTKLSDSRDHSYTVTVDRPAGELTIAVRVTDEFENHSVEKTILK